MKDFKFIVFLFIFGIISIPLRHWIFSKEKNISFYRSSPIENKNIPDCLKVFYAIEKYSDKYQIPIRYAFGIAYMETRYTGPLTWDYNAKQRSYKGALGPMQIMPLTANLIWNEEIPKDKIIHDIDFNIETSMKLLKILYEKYKNWKIVFGCYNTGKSIVNGYAESVYNFKIEKNNLAIYKYQNY